MYSRAQQRLLSIVNYTRPLQAATTRMDSNYYQTYSNLAHRQRPTSMPLIIGDSSRVRENIIDNILNAHITETTKYANISLFSSLRAPERVWLQHKTFYKLLEEDKHTLYVLARTLL
jgi:hypothetical protein